jgi:hypothetical protein
MPDDAVKTPANETLLAWSRGDRAALDQLLHLIHRCPDHAAEA